MAEILDTKPKHFRTGKSTGGDPKVDRSGGFRRAGVIRRASVITKGEALGHELWIDGVFLEQVNAAVNQRNKGVKSRFTHPTLSGDGLGKFVGRIMDAEQVGDQVLADQHFSQAGHRTPDGDLAGYLMDLAEEDPESYGLSIVFDMDIGSVDQFRADNEDQFGNFISPDPANTKNLLHARLASLHAVDAVDQPAANPDGLFHRQSQILDDANAVAEFALGLSDTPPTVVSLGMNPERVRGFVERFLEEHDLELREKTMATDQTTDNPSDDQPVDDAATTETASDETTEAGGEDTAATTDTGEDDTDTDLEESGDGSREATSEGDGGETAAAASVGNDIGTAGEPTAPAEELSDGQRFLEAFGDQGGVWFAQGISFEEAQAKHHEALAETLEQMKLENAKLKQRLSGHAAGESEAIDFGDGDLLDDKSTRKKTFADLVRMRDSAK